MDLRRRPHRRLATLVDLIQELWVVNNIRCIQWYKTCTAMVQLLRRDQQIALSSVTRGILPCSQKLNSISTDCNNPAPNEICVTQLKSAVPLPPVLLKPKPDFQFYLPIGLHAYSANEAFRPGTYKEFLSETLWINISTYLRLGGRFCYIIFLNLVNSPGARRASSYNDWRNIVRNPTFPAYLSAGRSAAFPVLWFS